MSEPTGIKIVDYDGLVAACRARADQLNISRDTIDEVAGLPKGYTSKALMAEPFGGKSATGGRLSSRNLGRVSLGPMLGALGIALVVVEDPEAMARTVRRREARNKSQVRMLPNGSIKQPRWLLTPAKSKKLNALRSEKLSDRQRQIIARKGARARWKKARRAKRRATSKLGDTDGGSSLGDPRAHYDVGAGSGGDKSL